MSAGERSPAARDVTGLAPMSVEPADESVDTPPVAAHAAEHRELRRPLSQEQRAEGDELWAPTFGATNAADGQAVITVHGDDVYIGGDFWQQMAGLPQFTYRRVAHWNGSSWRGMAHGGDARVRAIAVVGGDVY